MKGRVPTVYTNENKVRTIRYGEDICTYMYVHVRTYMHEEEMHVEVHVCT